MMFFSTKVFECCDQKTTSEQKIDKLCKYIYAKDSTDRLRTRAILCQIYHHALHDRWFKARDLMLMSHLQDNIQHSDVPTQVKKIMLCCVRLPMLFPFTINLYSLSRCGPRNYQ
jgi:hypothetical protein